MAECRLEQREESEERAAEVAEVDREEAADGAEDSEDEAVVRAEVAQLRRRLAEVVEQKADADFVIWRLLRERGECRSRAQSLVRFFFVSCTFMLFFEPNS